MTTKKCTKCKKAKPVNQFWKEPKRKDGLNAWCKTCMRNYNFQNRARLNEYQRKLYQENPDYFKEAHKRWAQTHREQLNAYKRKYYQEHKQRHKELCKKYYQEHKDEISAKKKARYKLKKQQSST